ncbi:PEP-CTERM sorting domain-containing protein [Massilia sp. ST3]|uniref:PEP-CTERM sorting domain-containing protein n=1 Tax=Massilia sp. ST3 TaxID=2824903 RepID=UPI001B82A8AF|nr:PEP-CTERM sorting domain-containing protein [Massilia sp. ST3]MBQ5947347.1 PEP-CTERM sorting domain-containing protein [Massilia sp. ST3]
MKFTKILSALLIVAAAGSAQAAPFVNGGFEDGNTNGWTTGGGYRGDVLNPLSPTDFLPGGSQYEGPSPRSSIITAGTVDPIIGAALGTTVYNGSYSYRAEDTTTGGYASVISQKVLNYTETDIFFAWKAVLEGAHDPRESAQLVIELRDDTTGTLLISRVYDGGGGVDGRFSTSGGYFYTPQWQIEQLSIDASLSGHDFTISLLAADCAPTGHLGYAYIDGFGGDVPPPTDVPEPASAALLMLGAGSLIAARRRKQRSA